MLLPLPVVRLPPRQVSESGSVVVQKLMEA